MLFGKSGSLIFKRRYLHMFLVTAAHCVLVAAAAASAFLLRFDFSVPHRHVLFFLYGLCIWEAVKPITFHFFGMDRSAWRFMSSPDALRLVLANITGSLLSTATIALIWGSAFPRSIYLLDFAFCLLLTGGCRVAVRIVVDISRRETRAGEQRAFIYGAGSAGVILVREIRSNPKMNYRICGFIDDDPSKLRMLIHGIAVIGAGEDLAALAKKHDVQVILVALPSATGQQMKQILSYCTEAKLRFQTVPSLAEIIKSGSTRIQIRDVAVEDLLGRASVRLDEVNIKAKLAGQVILVTGAGGSIGSELCRQVAQFNPQAIIGLDIAETALFHIDREIRQSFPDVPFEAAVGSIRNPDRLAAIFDQYRPTVVYHAGAYKHVPLMETHLFEAIENNILGTYNIALASERAGVSDFVMVSSDKAVRPTNVMGLTKRVAEIIIESLQREAAGGPGTNFVSVRFGNVLGSNGSVVPIFRGQIANGGPITITHPEMRRYFMTIPEAVQLVLQASTMGRGGEIFVLDMGDPVKIVDLARNLILLSGLRPDEDIKIEFTGTRPGEKLYEEISNSDEETRRTYHEKIRIFVGNGTRIHNVSGWIQDLRRSCALQDTEVILTLKELVPDYNPSAHIMRQLFRQSNGNDRVATISAGA